MPVGCFCKKAVSRRRFPSFGRARKEIGSDFGKIKKEGEGKQRRQQQQQRAGSSGRWREGGEGIGEPGLLRNMDRFGSDGCCTIPTDVKVRCSCSIRHTDRIMSNSGSVLRGFGIDNKYSISSGSTEDENPSCNEALEECLVYRIKNLDNRLITLPKVGSYQIVAFDEFKGSSGPSSLNQQLMLREDKASSKSDSSMRRKRTGWLRKLGAVACIVDRQGEESNSTFHDGNKSGIAGSGRVKVKPCGKRSKEFSAVYKVQDIKAHDGAILAMKSSPNDQCLASGGAEGIVLVWHVMVCERTNEISIPDNDPSCIYFTVNHSAELTPVHDDKKNTFKSRDMRRSADSACVVIPPDVFRLSEKPLRAFHRHDVDVLDLSWSSDKVCNLL
ncbi:hypothetical protein B296_00052720 [Ensete ventricosum]|uniref:Uncharacterized protein n=1 Tax=Ensete ventricosum TaxID=4639 RepID=A0A426YB49_ENSVE|nr:hypothetical protein B296_00052720 [Ensete ventricosum]